MLWLDEQAAQWTEVTKHSSRNVPLSGSILVHLGARHVHRQSIQNHVNFRSAVTQANKSTLRRFRPHLKPAFNPALKGILGPYPLPHIDQVHSPVQNSCTRPTCLSCGTLGLHSRKCRRPPRLPREAGDAVSASGDPSSIHSLNGGPLTNCKQVFYASFADYARTRLGSLPPPPQTVQWTIPRCGTWRIMAPEFAGDALESSAPAHPPIFSSFGEYARVVLGVSGNPPSVHVAWRLKTQTILLLFPRILWLFGLLILPLSSLRELNL